MMAAGGKRRAWTPPAPACLSPPGTAGQGQSLEQGGFPRPQAEPWGYPGPASHPTWSIPRPKLAPDAAPPITMATPILAGLPWLRGPQPQPNPQH